MKKRGFTDALISYIILTIIIVAVSSYFVFNETLIGPAFLVLGVVSLFFLKFYKIEIKTITPDIIFGAIDNGVLVFAAVLGGAFAGVAGAVVGGLAGNTITDGIGGLFEGYTAEKLRQNKINDQRTALSTMLGKITGCLFGAGIGLIIVWIIKMIFF